MTKEELIEYLKQNLKIEVNQGLISNPFEQGLSLVFELKLEDKVISSDRITLEVGE